MAKETNLNPLFLNTDFLYVHHVKNAAETAAVDITGWALSFLIKQKVASDEDMPALVTKTTGAGIVISGTYNADPTLNAQRATVTILDTDTVSLTPMRCVWELKRTDDGLETILGYGTVELKRAVHRS